MANIFQVLKTNTKFLNLKLLGHTNSQKSTELKPACIDREHLTHEEDLSVSAFHKNQKEIWWLFYPNPSEIHSMRTTGF